MLIEAQNMDRKNTRKKRDLGLDLGVFQHFNNRVRDGFEGNHEETSFEIKDKQEQNNISRTRELLNVSDVIN